MTFLKTTVATTALCLSLSAAWADGLTARINTSQLAEGDSLQLVLTTDGAGVTAPDLAPLAQEFEVLGTSQSSRTEVINGHRSQSTSWIVTLAPHGTGSVTIPSLQAGARTSDPLTVEVVEASQLPKLRGATGIALSATIDSDAAYYRFQEIPLSVRIETTQPLQSAELIAPTGAFELTPSGQDRHSQITRNGQPVTVIERDYLLRPETTGPLSIPPFTLKGAVRDPNARRMGVPAPFGGRDPFAMMDQMMARMGGMGAQGSPFDRLLNAGKPFAARSDAITLEVLENPNAATSDWFLPAKAVELRSDWQPDAPTFRTGEAVTRRISLMALGARSEQLPDLTFQDPTGARLYLDDVDTDMVETADGTAARRDFSLSVVPTQGGEVVLPAIKVDWLDTGSGETKTATLPALTIHVEGTAPLASSLPAALPDAVTVPSAPPPSLGVIGGLIVGLCLIGGAGLFVFWRRSNSPKGTRPNRQKPNAQKTAILADLRAVARTGAPRAFYRALMDLRACANATNRATIDAALARLDREVYGTPGPKTAANLSSLLKQVTERTTKKPAPWRWQPRDALPALYPQTGPHSV